MTTRDLPRAGGIYGVNRPDALVNQIYWSHRPDENTYKLLLRLLFEPRDVKAGQR